MQRQHLQQPIDYQQQQKAAEEDGCDHRKMADDSSHLASNSSHRGAITPSPINGSGSSSSICPRLLGRLLHRKEELMSLRAERRAASEGLVRNSKKHALTKLERQELRDIRLKLKALGSPWGSSRGDEPPGAVSIGLATLDQLRDDAGAAPRGAGVHRRGSSSIGDGGSVAEALTSLSPVQALVHECLSGAGVELSS